MLVRELISLLEEVDPNAEVVIRNLSTDEFDENALKAVDVQTGYFDEEVLSFTAAEEIEEGIEDGDGTFGSDAVALCVEPS